MRLYIIRHGKAEPESRTGLDKDRVLTPVGRRQAEWLGAHLAASGHAPARIVVSPFARADETARLVSAPVGAQVTHDRRLIVDAPTSGVLELIADHAEAVSLAIVGHNPQLERLCGMMSRQEYFAMATGMCCAFDIGDATDAVGSARFIEVLRSHQ